MPALVTPIKHIINVSMTARSVEIVPENASSKLSWYSMNTRIPPAIPPPR